MNTSIGKCFAKNNQELRENLEKNSGPVKSERNNKNKDEFISVICRYRPSAGDSKKNNYTI